LNRFLKYGTIFLILGNENFNTPLYVRGFSNLEKILSELERRLLAEIQHGMPKTSTPYKDVAEKLGVDVDQVLEILKNWKNDGRLRRVGAIVNHFKVGLQSGAMVVWQVEPNRIEEVGKLFASFPEVSHAYERPSSEQWPFNIYTMVHGADQDAVIDTVKKMSQQAGVENYRQLETVRELKKVPPTYIIE
jgi:DNA-binding Lrp family transcriptional regulator